MLNVLPLLVLGSFALMIWGRGLCWRLSLLLGATGWGLLVLSLTEGLSAFHLLWPGWVAGCWGGVCVVALGWLICRRSVLIARFRARPPRARWERGQGLLLAALGLMLIMLAIIGRRSPPQNYDSYTYHLPRVMHWMQEGSVAFFPTHIARQVTQPPFAEYLVLQTMMLSGGDYWANLVQWLAMIGSWVGVSYLAMRLGAGGRGQLFAVVVCATIPMGILQATTTQNNYVAAFWLVTAVVLGWEALRGGAVREGRSREGGSPVHDRQGNVPWLLMGTVGAALGLALLTKASAYLFAFPFCMLFAIGARRYRWKAVPALLLVALGAMAINAPHYARNERLSGYPLGPPSESFAGPYFNADFTWQGATSNTIRNVAMELATPWKEVNSRIEQAARWAHRWLNFNPDEPRWTWAQHSFQLSWLWNHDDLAGSPIHVLLILSSLPLLFFLKRGQRRRALLYLVMLLMGGEMFCLLLRWQVYSNRLLLPLLVLGSPVAGLVLEHVWPRRAAGAMMVLLLACAIPVVVDNFTTPLAGHKGIFHVKRVDQRFHSDRPMRRHYQRIAEAVRASGCRNVGLLIAPNEPEYPLWVMLRQSVPGVRIEHVQVNNFTGVLQERPSFRDFFSCVLIEVKSLKDVRILSLPPAASAGGGRVQSRRGRKSTRRVAAAPGGSSR